MSTTGFVTWQSYRDVLGELAAVGRCGELSSAPRCAGLSVRRVTRAFPDAPTMWVATAQRRRFPPKTSMDMRSTMSSEMTMTTTPTMTAGLNRDATRKHPTAAAPMRTSQDCHGLDVWLATSGV